MCCDLCSLFVPFEKQRKRKKDYRLTSSFARTALVFARPAIPNNNYTCAPTLARSSRSGRPPPPLAWRRHRRHPSRQPPAGYLPSRRPGCLCYLLPRQRRALRRAPRSARLDRVRVRARVRVGVRVSEGLASLGSPGYHLVRVRVRARVRVRVRISVARLAGHA